MIYLDHSATTPLDPAVLKKMLPYFSRSFANPASIHSLGQAALKAVEDARYNIASIIGAKATEIVFTSGATEANNLALQGLIKALRSKGDKRGHIITSAIEHDSILEPLHMLERYGCKITRLPVNKEGIVSPENLRKAIREDTVLVTIGFVNSELGSVQAIDKLGRVIRKLNEKRQNDWQNTAGRKRGAKPRPIYFHCDATQAFNSFSCKANYLNVDLMSLSGHKVYGPKGIGLLYVKRDTPLEAIQYGGHQERNLRSGTLNVPAIIGLSEALKTAERLRPKYVRTVKKIRNAFVKEVLKLIPEAKLTIPLNNNSPCHANLLFPGVSGDSLLLALDEMGVAASTGSACASGDLDASHVIAALGYKENIARSALRFSFGRSSTLKEAKLAANKLKKAYNMVQYYYAS